MISNANAQAIIDNCNSELDKLEKIIEVFGATHRASGFLTRYALLKCSTSLENCYKTIIADYYENQAPTLSHYLNNMVRNATRNANLDNIHKFLKEFDHTKHLNFKDRLSNLADMDSILREFKELAKARNDLAHDSSMTMSFNEIKTKYISSVRIMEELDETMR